MIVREFAFILHEQLSVLFTPQTPSMLHIEVILSHLTAFSFDDLS